MKHIITFTISLCLILPYGIYAQEKQWDINTWTWYSYEKDDIIDTNDDAIDTAQDYNSTRSNRRKNEMIDDSRDLDYKNDSLTDTQNILPKADYQDFYSDNDIIPTRIEKVTDIKQTRSEWDTEKLRNARIQVKDDSTLWCWGKAARGCSPEVREERREIMKERLQIEAWQYQRLQKQFQPRVQRLFERLSEEEYDRLSERLASLIEQHQDWGNIRLLSAILALQELLESVAKL